MERFFRLSENGTTVRKEFLAGLTTFLAMSYILFVNTDILSATGMDPEAVFVATGLAAAIGTLLMGLLANYPVALAPGMGINAFFAFTVVLTMGIPWQTALAGTFISGFIFFILTLTKIRETIINAIPEQLKLAVGAGIGLFITFIGLQNSGVIIGDDATLVSLGDLTSPAVLLTVFGLVITAIFMVRGFKGAIFYGLVLTALAGVIFGLSDKPDGIVSTIPSLAPTFGVLFENFWEHVFTPEMLIVIFTLLFVDFFDTAGTLVAVAKQAGLLKDGKLPRAGRALSADAVATMTGAVLGTSTTTSYVESSAGVAVGGRTGLTAVFTAGFFIVALFFSPLLSVVTANVTAPALILVGVLMASALKDIKWDKMEYAIPAFLTFVTMGLTYSISTGIALGFILYPIFMVVKGKYKEVHPIMYVLGIIFFIYLGWLVE